MPRARSLVRQYGIAVVATIVALLLEVATSAWTAPTPFKFFFGAVGVAAWVGGPGPGLLATLLGGVLVAVLVMPPLFSLTLSPDYALALAVFVAVSALISLLAGRAEEARRQAREAEARLMAVVAQLPVGVVVAEVPSGHAALVNDEARRITGDPLAPGLVIERYDETQTFRGLRPNGRPYAPEEWPLARAVRRGESVAGEEIALVRGDGTRVVIQASAAPLRDRAGHIIAAVTAFVDVTALKRAEGALRATSERLEIALRAARMVAWEWNPIAGPVPTSHAFPEIQGMTALGSAEPGSAAVHPDDQERREAAIREALVSGGNYHGEFRFLRSDSGRPIWLEERGTVVRDAAGAARAMVGVALDVTERKAAEAERERLLAEVGRREREFATLAEHSPDVVFRLDREMRHRYINAAVEAVTGLPPAAFLGKTGREAGLPAEICDRFEAFWRAVVTEGRPGHEQAFDFTHEGKEFRCRLIPERGADGTFETVLGITEDVTAQRAHARRQREFLAMVAHDLKGPLAGIRALAQLLRRRAVYNERWVATIDEETRRMTRLVDDLADIARLEEGQLELRREAIDLLEVVGAAVARARATTERHPIQVVTPAAPVVGRWDRDRLGQVLENLLGNAIKYSPDGGEIVVEVREERHEVEIRVRDHGMGIPPEARERVFARFYRTDEARAGGIAGTGLGLAIVKGLVEAHGGRVGVESAVGPGSVFTVTLPREAPLAPPA